jgi:hypothetical protein
LAARTERTFDILGLFTEEKMIRHFPLLASAILVCSLQAQQNGAPADLATDLKQNYTSGKNKIVAAAEEMSEAGYSFQPTPEERNFGAWVAHLADSQATFCGAVSGNPKKLDAASKTSKADLVAALKESFEICDAVYDGTTGGNANDSVPTFSPIAPKSNRDPIAMATLARRGPRPRASWLWFNVAHNEECYGSMAVYLRLQKLVPPSSQGRGNVGKKQ